MDILPEMILSKIPTILGSGIPLFGYLKKGQIFKHVKTDIYKNGIIKSHYKRVKDEENRYANNC